MSFFKNIFKSKIAKVPIIMQLEALECGAACLAMILAYYKKFIPIEKLRIDCGVSKTGSTAKNMIIAAKKYNLNAYGVKIDVDELKNSDHFPCIIHWNFNHFVVLNGFKKNKAFINDPANGHYCVDLNVFSASFTGICLFLTPNNNFKTSGKPKTITNFIINNLKNSTTAFAITITISSLILIINLIKPGFSQFFIDRILTGQNYKQLFYFSFIFTMITIINLILIWIESTHFLKIKGQLTAHGSSCFMWHILHLPLSFFAQRFTGEIQMRHQFNASIANQIINIIVPLILNSLTVFICFIIMIRYNIILTAIVLLCLLFIAIISNIISKQQINISKIKIKKEGQLAATTIAGFNMIETIKANCFENIFFKTWSGINAKLTKIDNKVNENLIYMPKLLSNLSIKIVVIIGAFLIIQKQFTLGMIITFNMFLKIISKPINSFLSTNLTLQETKTKIERIEDVMHFKRDFIFDNSSKSSLNIKKLSGKIEIKNLTFSYTPNSNAVINNFNLKINPGDRIAILGESNSGKSTIASLIMGLLKPQNGLILFDNKPISEINKDVFINSVAIIQQHSFFFEDSIKNNLTIFNNTINHLNIIKAAKKAQIHDIIIQRGGYDSKIIQNAQNFSTGQKQQLEFARIFIQKPQILILDEATSALDIKTESKILNEIFKDNLTCIIISHKPSTLQFCNKFIKLS